MTKAQRTGLMSSLRQDWATPSQLFETLNREFQFALDVCATADTAKCRRYIDKAEDATGCNWEQLSCGQACWMNPPYGRDIGRWIEKASREARLGCTVVALLPARTDTSWFHAYILGKCEIRFLRGRLEFDGTKRARAPFPSMIVIFR
jgi:phage N-6-adenine-methyltransferase